MARTLNQALAFAKKQVTNPSQNWRRLCLAFVRQCWGYPTSGIPTAYAGSKMVKKTTKGTPPPGAIVWWKGPTSAGHVAISAGNGYCYSNDFKRSGKIDKVKIKDITRGWNCTYLGWSENYPNQPKLPLDGLSSTPPAPGGGSSKPKSKFKVGDRVVVTAETLNARLKPSTGSGSYSGRTVNKGYQIKVEKVDGSWVRGAKYWYHTDYLKADSGPYIGQWRVVSTDAGLNARYSPDGKIRATVDKGYRIKVTEMKKVGGRTWIKGATYWYAAEYTKAA